MSLNRLALGLSIVLFSIQSYSLSPPPACPQAAGKEAEYKICLLERRVAAMESRARMDRNKSCVAQHRAENPRWRRDECMPILLSVSDAADDLLCLPGAAANVTLQYQGMPDFQGGVSYSAYKTGDPVIAGAVNVKVKCTNKVWKIVK